MLCGGDPEMLKILADRKCCGHIVKGPDRKDPEEKTTLKEEGFSVTKGRLKNVL